jgi:acyl-homoserine lactone acylase PvdQ
VTALTLDVTLDRGAFVLAVRHELALDGITALFGPSGSGKTTLLRVIAGLEQSARGTVTFDGTPWQRDGERVPAHDRGIGYVFQDGRLFPHLTIEGNLRFALTRAASRARRSRPIDFATVVDALDLGYRAARITELLDDAGPLDVAGMASIAFDGRESFAATLVPYLRDAAPGDEEVQRAVALFEGWDFGQPPESAPAAFYAAPWRAVMARTFHDELASLPEEQREEVLPGGGDRWFAVVEHLLEEPDNAWWDDVGTPLAEHRDDILAAALIDASTELRSRLGGDPTGWRWGRLHTLDLRNPTFGESGVGPIEWLFNRGPLELGGGEDSVDAVGVYAPDGYAVDWVPSMRMVVDLSDLDGSRWINLTGASGHAFSAHYDDQAPLWARGELADWPFTPDALAAATDDLLTLRPAEE